VLVTTEEFERLNEQQAEQWLAERFRRFVDSGLPPDLSLIFAVHPNVEAPQQPPATRRTAGPNEIAESFSEDETPTPARRSA
jgi:hypothetical protein